MILKSNNQLGVDLTAIPTTELDCIVSYRDRTSTTFETNTSFAKTNGTTDSIILTAPSGESQRIVDFISIFNNNSANVTIELFMLNTLTKYTLVKVTLMTNERLEFNGSSFTCYDSSGAEKTISTSLISPIGSNRQILALSADVVNNNAVANTLQDTGLQFTATATKLYYFKAFIPYSAAATTTGSRWVLASTAVATKIIFESKYSLTTTTATLNGSVQGYNLPALCNATSASTLSNMAILQGFIVLPSTDIVKIRFASEVASSAITALKGAYIEYQQLD